MANSERHFILDRDVSKDEDKKDYSRSQNGQDVVVQLIAGDLHKYLAVEYKRRDSADDPVAFTVGSSYEVLPSGALAIIGWQVWSEGWSPGTNDRESIVATYGPGQWVLVTGHPATDPHNDAMQKKRLAAKQRQ